jgi:AcrR family transcriptional regulator
MARKTDAREKALRTAERLFRTQGLAATGLAQIITESGAPKGSFYFHFPGGKDQLASEVAERFASHGLAAIRSAAAVTTRDAKGFVELLCNAFAAEMNASKFALGCALQNIAAEKAPYDHAMTATLETAFQSWTAAITEHLADCEVNDARGMATALLAALEGARTLARVQGNDAAFRAIAGHFAASLRESAEA